MTADWTLPPDEELKSHIENYHLNSVDERLERYKFIWKIFGPPTDLLLVGGFQASLALEEMRLCYIDGYFLACVLLAQIFIENSLGGAYIIAGNEALAEQGFYSLIEQALGDKIIDTELATRFHELRTMRNPYVHPKAGAGSRTLMGRILAKSEQGKRYESIIEFAKDDAEKALQTVADYMRYEGDQNDQLQKPPAPQI